MINLIAYNHEPSFNNWTDKQRRWIGVCEFIIYHWYYMVTPDEFAELYRLRYQKIKGQPVTGKMIRDIYVHQYHSEFDYRGEEEFDDIKKRDTQLTPIVDDKGNEYFVRNTIEMEEDDDKAEEIFNAMKKAHGDKKMYIPTIDEMEEYFEFGFNPGNEGIITAFSNLTELFPDMEPKQQDYTVQTLVNNAVAAFELPVNFERVCKEIVGLFSFKPEQVNTVVAQLRVIFNNTHMPTNKGYTPKQLSEYYGYDVSDED